MVTQVTESASNETPKVIPGISELPLVGSMFRHSHDRISLYQYVASECGAIGQFHFGPYKMVQLNDAALMHKALVEHHADLDKGDGMRKAFQPVIGNGLFISDGDLHRKQRKLMAPSFQPRHITGYADAMVAFGEQIQQLWPDGTSIEANHEMTRLTMSIVGKVLFNSDVFTESDELGHAMTTVLSFINYSLSHLLPMPLSWSIPRSIQARKALAVLDWRIQQMIDERGAHSEEQSDFLSVLLQAQDEDGKHMSNQQVRDEALTLFGAGHETTATALTWVWYLLAQHPDIYQKVQREVDTVLEGHSPTYADLVNLPYSLQVFKEAMRLYPPAYAITRVALRDFVLDGYPIHQNEIILFAIYAMHHRPEYYPDPERFDPERFTPENEKRLPRYAYMPFGAGPRICIGNHFALMEGHLLLATLAQRVTFELVAGTHCSPDPNKTITIRPDRDMRMIVHRRSNAYG
ncbi:MAG TPA: cytochrome P450 [Dictyobacter sp.]|nr:cytochrome P450 [Dictyobacter sp.]